MSATTTVYYYFASRWRVVANSPAVVDELCAHRHRHNVQNSPRSHTGFVDSQFQLGVYDHDLAERSTNYHPDIFRSFFHTHTHLHCSGGRCPLVRRALTQKRLYYYFFTIYYCQEGNSSTNRSRWYCGGASCENSLCSALLSAKVNALTHPLYYTIRSALAPVDEYIIFVKLLLLFVVSRKVLSEVFLLCIFFSLNLSMTFSQECWISLIKEINL